MLRNGRILLIAMTVIGISIFSQLAISGELKVLDVRSNDIHCASCALNVKRTVSKLDGVGKVDVSVSEKTIHVEYDNSKVTESQIIRKINDSGLGYKSPEQYEKALKET